MKSFSYSALTTAYKCNQLYKYLFIDKLDPKKPKSGDMAFGTAIHLGVEAILTQGVDSVGLFDLYWNIEKTRGNRYGRYTWENLREQGHVFLTRFERLHAKKFVVMEMEQRLYGSLSDIKIEGTPDFIGDYQGKKTIVDFKTSGTRYSKSKGRTSEQLFLYAELARQNYGFLAEQILYVVFIKGTNPSIQFVSERVTETKINLVKANVALQAQELTTKIDTSKFTRNYANCIYGETKCDFFEVCHGAEIDTE